jgi:hypothetical protein
MVNVSTHDSDTFESAKLWGIICKVAGGLLIAGGVFNFFFGFQLNGVEYSGLMAGLAFALPGVSILGIGYLLSTAATIGELLLADRKLWIRAAYPESRIENPKSSG